MSTPVPMTAAAPPDLTGRELGDYSLLRRLGRGGMADVYLARQRSLQRNVALKILKPDLAVDESYVRRFEREAQSAATLSQANIVQIFEVGNREGLHFIAQEYVHGRNLRQFFDRHGAVDPVMALSVLRQCALALQKASEFGVIHRDIKPENIMISTNGEVKVTDFGLARINNNATQQALTQIGITMGTPLYMSPEQVAGSHLDSRSDIYSLGVTAYHMLAGKPPFEGENALAIAVQQVQDSAPPLQDFRPDVPDELVQVIERMMSKDPDQRPQSPAALLKELRNIEIDAEEDWHGLLEKLSLSDFQLPDATATVPQSRLAATQQLQQLIQGPRRPWWKNPRTWLTTGLMSLVAIFAGSVLAQRSLPPFPLDVNLDKVHPDEIPRQETIEEQYTAAYWGTYGISDPASPKKVDYWQAVLNYFPLDKSTSENRNKTQLYRRRAQSRLGEVYLSQRKLPEALAIYETLESYEGISEQFRITGSAGKAITYDLMAPQAFAGGAAEREQQVRECLGKVGAKTDLLNEYLRDAVTALQARYPATPPTLPPGQ